MQIEVAYAKPEEQLIVALEVNPDCTVADAIQQSGLLPRFPEIDLAGGNKTGIFGKLCKLDQVLQEGDRVEIYRPLLADPKENRRLRAGKR
ncbi:MAG: RnfH family protein [Candidatus Methylumidiphilus sp.]